MLYNLVLEFIKIIEDATKSLVATATGAVTGYVPMLSASINNVQPTSYDMMFQYTVWTITIIVGVLAIINGIQKQIDRIHKKKINETDTEEN